MINSILIKNKEIISNTLYLFLEKALLMIASIVAGVLVARYLGPEKFGAINFIYSIVLILGSVCNLGLSQVVVKRLSKTNGEDDNLIGTSLILIFLFSVLSNSLFVAYGFVYQTEVRWIYLILSFILPLQFANIFDFYYQYHLKSKFKVFAKVVATVCVAALKILFVYLELPLIFFAWAYAGEIVLYSVIITATFFWKRKLKSLIVFDTILSKSLLRESWPLLFSGLLIVLYMKMDKIMLGIILGDLEVGIYTAASRLSESWYFVGIAISQSLFPKILEIKKLKPEKLNNSLIGIYRLMIYLALPVVLVIYFLSPFIIDFLFGVDYQLSSEVLRIHIVSSIFVFIGLIGNKWLVSNDLQQYSMYKSFVGFLCNLLLNYLLIPRYGVSGAAWATLISQFVASYLFFAFSSKIRLNFYLISKAFYPSFKNLT